MRINVLYIAPMSTNKRNQQKSDWHPADVVAAIRKAGWSLRRLSIHHGYTPTALHNALHVRWPKAQRLIAEAIGKQPEQIWPSRYQKKRMRS
ncbi:MAG: helix-turn-helix transcriptional regulator [Candidatus Contendobacter sp.]|nr:helix-turn-helix transcriptional regulator [Candidatus Contendobacter sp.]